jgi:hypothetical protein
VVSAQGRELANQVTLIRETSREYCSCEAARLCRFIETVIVECCPTVAAQIKACSVQHFGTKITPAFYKKFIPLVEENLHALLFNKQDLLVGIVVYSIDLATKESDFTDGFFRWRACTAGIA